MLKVIAGGLIAAAATIAAVLLGRYLIIKGTELGTLKRITTILACIFAFAVLALVIVWFFTKTPETASVRITYPVNGSKVAPQEIVRGTSRNLGDKSFRVFVYVPSVRRHYPQTITPKMLPNGDWEEEVQFGVSGDSGLRFEAEAVLLDENARKILGDYLSKAEQAQSWPGMEGLPKRADVYDRVTVVRE
jgi:hypothetical protein